VDVATQQEVLTAIRSVSGLITFGYAFKTFFYQNGKLANRKYIEKAFSNFLK